MIISTNIYRFEGVRTTPNCQNIPPILHLRPVLETPRSQLYNDSIIRHGWKLNVRGTHDFAEGCISERVLLIVVHPVEQSYRELH